MNAITTLHADVHHTRELKAKVDQTVHDTIIATRIVDGFRNPQQHGAHLKNHATFPLECVFTVIPPFFDVGQLANDRDESVVILKHGATSTCI